MNYIIKKYFSACTVILLYLSAVFFISCGSGNKKMNPEEGIWKTAGWVDDNTYRIRAMGEPNPELKNENDKRASARRRAVIKAKYDASLKFKRIVDEQCRERTKYDVTFECSGMLNAGSVVADRYDSSCNCEILYEVQMKNLKRRADLTDSD